jgi:uncharacterized repeat protein (TIGR01451 family)
MSIQRSSAAAARRLRVEVLEDRAVPAVLTGTEPTTVTPPATDPTKPAVTDTTPPADTTDTPVVTSVDGEVKPPDPEVKPTDPAPGGVVPPAVTDPEVVMTATGGPGGATTPVVDLATTTTVDKPVPSVGDTVTITVKVTNRSADAATGVAVDAALPAGMTFVSASAGQGTYDAATGAWAPGAVLPGAPQTLTIKAKVTDAADQSVSAAISHADQTDPNTGNNTAGATVNPVTAGLKVSQTINTRVAMVGSVVLVTMTVRNTGPGAATNVAVKETLGPGLLFVRALTPSRGSFNAGTRTWTIPSLPAGMTAQVQMIAQVSQSGQVQATATATGAGIDPAISQLDATAALTVIRTNVPIAWTYFSGIGFKPATTPVTVPATPSTPTVPVTSTPAPKPVLSPPPASATVAQVLMARGFILPAGFRL